MHSYAAGTRRYGAVLHTRTEVTGADITCGEVRSVTVQRAGTTHVIEISCVLVAAGAWSEAVGQLVGVDLPVRPLHREIVVTGPGRASTRRSLPDLLS